MKRQKQLKEAALNLSGKGLTVTDIAKSLSIDRKTFYQWINSDEEFKKEYEKSRSKLDVSVKNLVNKALDLKLKKHNGQVGYVYLIRCGEFKYYKIGISKNDPHNRLSCMQSGCPFVLKFEHMVYTPDYRRLELKLHMKYKEKNKIGEWFELDDNELKDVISDMDLQTNQMTLF